MSERLWLVLGLVAGLALTAIGVVEREPPALPRGAAATVNGAVIARDDLTRALDAVARHDPNRSPDQDLAGQVLERMVEEELLVQRGLELGLPSRDPQLRTLLSRAVLDLVVAEGELAAEAVSESELEAFFTDNRAYFSAPPRLRVRAASFSSEGDARRAREKSGVNAGAPVVGLSSDLVPLPALARVFGDRVTRRVASLQVGELSEALAHGDDWLLVQVEARERGDGPTFDAARERVAAEYRRRAGERALRSFLADRRSASRIAIAESAP